MDNFLCTTHFVCKRKKCTEHISSNGYFREKCTRYGKCEECHHSIFVYILPKNRLLSERAYDYMKYCKDCFHRKPENGELTQEQIERYENYLEILETITNKGEISEME